MASSVEKAALFAQLEFVFGAGLSAQQAFLTLAKQEGGPKRRTAVDSRLVAALLGTAKRVGSGMSVAQAGRRAGLFGPREGLWVEVFEQLGLPQRAFALLAADYERRAARLGALRSRLVWPAMVFLVSVATMPLPAIARGELQGSDAFWAFAGPLCWLALWIFVLRSLLGALDRGRPFWLDALVLRLPVLGPVRRACAQWAFLSALAELLGAGVDALSAHASALRLVISPGMRRRLEAMRPVLENGQSWASAAEVCECVPAPARAVLVAAEASGDLPRALRRYCGQLEGELEDARDRLWLLASWSVSALVLLRGVV